jgi:hypothetical protein
VNTPQFDWGAQQDDVSAATCAPDFPARGTCPGDYGQPSGTGAPGSCAGEIGLLGSTGQGTLDRRRTSESVRCRSWTSPAHERFDARAKTASWEFVASRHLGVLLVGLRHWSQPDGPAFVTVTAL